MRTYNQLKNSVIALVDREDYQVSDNIGGGTTDYADAWIERGVRSFYRTDAARTPPFELFVTGTLSEGDNAIRIPADFRELRRIVVTRDQIQTTLSQTSPEDVFTRNTSAQFYVPQEFAREGARWFTDKVSGDVDYTVYYYGTLVPISDITQENYDATVANYRLGRLSIASVSGTTLYFPTGTTQTQARDNFATLTPTTTATTANTVPYLFSGNPVTHWLLNEAGECILYLAAIEAALFYGGMESETRDWQNRARNEIDMIIRDSQRMDGSGTTPRIRKPGKYSSPINTGRGGSLIRTGGF